MRMTDGSAGMDLCAAVTAGVVLKPGAIAAIPCGFAIQIPRGFEGQVRPRSGLALRNGVTVLNAPGTIDSDYRGEVAVILINHGPDDFTVEPNSRIAQLVICPVVEARLVEVEALDSTSRGTGGFGHTGVSP
jgi:dUTP pyrophosphatase